MRKVTQMCTPSKEKKRKERGSKKLGRGSVGERKGGPPRFCFKKGKEKMASQKKGSLFHLKGKWVSSESRKRGKKETTERKGTKLRLPSLGEKKGPPKESVLRRECQRKGKVKAASGEDERRGKNMAKKEKGYSFEEKRKNRLP